MLLKQKIKGCIGHLFVAITKLQREKNEGEKMYVGSCFTVNGAAGDTSVVKKLTVQLQECMLDIAHIPVESKAKYILQRTASDDLILPVSPYVLKFQTNPPTEENKIFKSLT